MTAPNLNGHVVQSNDNYNGQENGRKMGPSYSRHYEYDYNGHRIPRANFNNNNQIPANDEQFPRFIQYRLVQKTIFALLAGTLVVRVFKPIT